MAQKKAATKTTKNGTAKKAATKTAKPVAAKKATVATAGGDDASRRIDRRIAELDDWRGRTLARVRRIIRAADPAIVEEWKWENPVWSRDGIICTGESYKAAVKLTFPKGASLDDPAGLFNSSLEGNARRAIDIREADDIDERALTALIRAAIALNVEKLGSARR